MTEPITFKRVDAGNLEFVFNSKGIQVGEICMDANQECQYVFYPEPMKSIFNSVDLLTISKHLDLINEKGMDEP